MTDRQKAEERLAKEAAEIMGYPATPELVLERARKPLKYSNLIDASWKLAVSRELEMEKLREMAKEVIAVGQPHLEDCDIIGMKDGGWKAKMPRLSQWLSICSKAAKWKSALPEAPKEGL